ncbi:MAG: T9SS type A sorting domain-containing protein [Candidatus Kapabacteria bacterium]|nr:T9SS type A sorting domain-containing protein [Candidatus Kapabacteria bacterium]
MNKLAFVGVLSFVMVYSAASQLVEFPMTFVNVLPTERKAFNFTFAAHPRATADVDTLLGEREIPSIPPPAGVYFVYTVPPSVEYLWLSPKDIRKMKAGVRFREDYDVNILWTGGKLEVSWKSPLPELVDSAYLVDALTDFPDNFIKVKIEPGTSFTTDNPAITRLKLLVWYNGTTTGVNEDAVPSNISLHPNPTTDGFFLDEVEPGSIISMIDVQGAFVAKTEATSPRQWIDLSSFASGLYVAVVLQPNGTVVHRTVVRQ